MQKEAFRFEKLLLVKERLIQHILEVVFWECSSRVRGMSMLITGPEESCRVGLDMCATPLCFFWALLCSLCLAHVQIQ